MTEHAAVVCICTANHEPVYIDGEMLVFTSPSCPLHGQITLSVSKLGATSKDYRQSGGSRHTSHMPGGGE